MVSRTQERGEGELHRGPEVFKGPGDDHRAEAEMGIGGEMR